MVSLMKPHVSPSPSETENLEVASRCIFTLPAPCRHSGTSSTCSVHLSPPPGPAASPPRPGNHPSSAQVGRGPRWDAQGPSAVSQPRSEAVPPVGRFSALRVTSGFRFGPRASSPRLERVPESRPAGRKHAWAGIPRHGIWSAVFIFLASSFSWRATVVPHCPQWDKVSSGSAFLWPVKREAIERETLT